MLQSTTLKCGETENQNPWFLRYSPYYLDIVILPRYIDYILYDIDHMIDPYYMVHINILYTGVRGKDGR